jgi:hypothetical protein
MTTADLAPLGSQQAAQHPRTCERELQVQLVQPPHQRKVRIRHRRWFVVDAASTDAEDARNCSASCAIVRSFFRAARATFALKAGVWFRRARFFIFAPYSQAKHACRQAESPLNALFKIPEPPLGAWCSDAASDHHRVVASHISTKLKVTVPK